MGKSTINSHGKINYHFTVGLNHQPVWICINVVNPIITMCILGWFIRPYPSPKKNIAQDVTAAYQAPEAEE